LSSQQHGSADIPEIPSG